ncbi:MAG: DUF2625 family protein [Acidobacteriota bacterium]
MTTLARWTPVLLLVFVASEALASGVGRKRAQSTKTAPFVAAPVEPQSLDQLVDVEASGWAVVEQLLKTATNGVEVLPATAERADDELLRLQANTRSTLGAVVHATGGLLVADGFVRVLGSGHERLSRGLTSWNVQLTGSMGGPGYLLIADDAVGGFFALNVGALPGQDGSVFYLAQDSAHWQDMRASYTDFLRWLFHGDLDDFYEELRWKGWRNDVAELSAEEVVLFQPFPWIVGKSLDQRRRSIHSPAEAFRVLQEFGRADASSVKKWMRPARR